MKELHEQGIIHRDIKAANILFTRDGEVKLTDFGLSRHVGSPDGKLQSMAGCPHYMAPEVTVSERSPDLAYDSRADVWSLGTFFPHQVIIPNIIHTLCPFASKSSYTLTLVSLILK